METGPHMHFVLIMSKDAIFTYQQQAFVQLMRTFCLVSEESFIF